MQHTTLAVTFTALVIGTIAALVAWRVARPGTTKRVLLALFASGVVALVAAWASLFVLVPRGLDEWGVVHLAYLLLTVSIPMVGVALVITGWRDARSWLAIAVGALLVVPAPLGLYATHVEPSWLRTDHLDLALDPSRTGDDPILVAVLSDIQTNRIGAHEREAVDRVMAAEPDIILIPGDLFQGDRDEIEREADAMRELLGRLHAPGGVYFVQGDSDHYLEMTTLLPGTDITPLLDEVVDVEVHDRTVRVGGIRNSRYTGHSGRPMYSSRSRDTIDSLESAPEDGTIRILVAHRPDAVNELDTDSRIDLVVSGHTHGGQVVLPLIGPPVTLTDVPRDLARGGLHEVDGNAIVVSPGVGMVRGQAPQVRFLSRPAVVLVEMR